MPPICFPGDGPRPGSIANFAFLRVVRVVLAQTGRYFETVVPCKNSLFRQFCSAGQRFFPRQFICMALRVLDAGFTGTPVPRLATSLLAHSHVVDVRRPTPLGEPGTCTHHLGNLREGLVRMPLRGAYEVRLPGGEPYRNRHTGELNLSSPGSLSEDRLLRGRCFLLRRAGKGFAE